MEEDALIQYAKKKEFAFIPLNAHESFKDITGSYGEKDHKT